MKYKWTKLLPSIILIFFISACSVGLPSGNGIVSSTYPGQFLVGDVYVLNNQEEINGDIAGFDTTLIVKEGAKVNGDISLFSSQVEISGHINGDINVFGGNTQIKETAVVSGSISQIASELDIDPDALITGEINAIIFPEKNIPETVKIPEEAKKWVQPLGWIIFQVVRSVLLLLINILIIFLFKDPTLRVVQQIQTKTVESWGVGLLIILAIPIISIVFLVTICLSPIALILFLIYGIVNIWGWTAITYFVGDTLTRWLHLQWSEILTVITGSIILGLFFTALGLIPFVGMLISFFISAVGIGGVVLSKLGTIEKSK